MIQQDTTNTIIADSLKNDSSLLADSLSRKDSVIQQLDTIVQTIEKRFDGVVHPSLPSTENWVFVLVIVLFALLIYSIIRSDGWIIESIRTFFQVKERSSIFSTATVTNIQSTSALRVFSTLVFSIYAFVIFHTSNYDFTFVTWLKFLAVTTGFLLFKYFSIRIIGYVFFDLKTIKLAQTAYFNILSYTAILLFPLLLFQIYSIPLIQDISGISALIVCILGAIMVIIKVFQIFLHKIVALFYILLYLCTLEILPLIILFSVYKLML